MKEIEREEYRESEGENNLRTMRKEGGRKGGRTGLGLDHSHSHDHQ